MVIFPEFGEIFVIFCKWAYFRAFQKNGDIANGHICKKSKKMGILKWAYSICPFLQMGIFFSNGHILPNMPKNKTYELDTKHFRVGPRHMGLDA